MSSQEPTKYFCCLKQIRISKALFKEKQCKNKGCNHLRKYNEVRLTYRKRRKRKRRD